MKENPGKKPLKKSDDDFDFEILNALEGHASSDDLLTGDENTIELSLDDDDLQFDDDTFEPSGEFSFDEGLSAGLEEELMKSGANGGLEDSFEEELDEDGNLPAEEDESFALDLGSTSEEFSFDEDAMSLDLEKTSFESISEEEEGFEAQNDELDAEVGNLAENYGAETRVFTIPQEKDNDLSFEKAMEIDEELNLSEDDSSASEIDISGMDIEESELEADEQEIDIDEEFADLEEDIDQGGEDLFEEEDELSVKSVISVGEDTVIDLGHEDDFDAAPIPPRMPTPTPPVSEMIAEEREEEPVEEDHEPAAAPSGVLLDLHEEETESEEETFDATPLNLNEEAAPELEPEAEESGEAAVESAPVPAPEMPEESEATFPVDEEMPQEELSQELPEPPMEEERDEREFLGLTLRLRDEQMQEFEGMIGEAKTLQTYLEELGTHQPEIKSTIYQKLFGEYNARKRVIFQDDAFTGLLANVEQDLQDMLDQRQDFTTTVTRLNEELEEITVRHLVGEYTDQVLAEKTEEQTTEIALWNEKTEKIQAIIERYQHAIDAERLLNPLRIETPPAPEVAPPLQQETPPMPVESQPSLPEAPKTPAATMPVEEASSSEIEDEGEPSEDISLSEETLSESDESLDEDLMSGLSDLTQSAFGESGEEEEESDLLGGEDESEEFGAEFSEDEDFEGGDFLVDDLSGLEDLDEEMEGEDEHVSFDYDVETESEDEEEPAAAAMIACKKCGRQTPEDQKFCVHCGGKAK